MNKFYTLVKFIIGWPVAFLSLFFVFKIIQPNLSLIIPKIIQINIPLLFIGLIFFQLYFLTRSILWQKLLIKSGFRITISEAIFLWMVSELKRYTPGNIWSFLGRVISFSNKGIPKKTVLKLMLFEAQFFVIGGFIVSLLAAPLI
ncbi:hypothetical protein KKG52_00635, partial [Patescibacteria group bacterium]|nr:hypothetical protein [Patescibacteria group bacterium]